MSNENTTVAEPEVQDPVVLIKTTVTELNTVLAALQELPHRAVDNLIKNIVAQAQAQLKE